jgi:hypothetical protein
MLAVVAVNRGRSAGPKLTDAVKTSLRWRDRNPRRRVRDGVPDHVIMADPECNELDVLCRALRGYERAVISDSGTWASAVRSLPVQSPAVSASFASSNQTVTRLGGLDGDQADTSCGNPVRLEDRGDEV